MNVGFLDKITFLSFLHFLFYSGQYDFLINFEFVLQVKNC